MMLAAVADEDEIDADAEAARLDEIGSADELIAAVDGTRPPVTREDPKPFCNHAHVRLDDAGHRVFCDDCGDEVDPWAFLAKMASEWSRHRDAIRDIRRRRNHAQDELDEIRRLERNAKSRLRAARKSLIDESEIRARLNGLIENIDSVRERDADPEMILESVRASLAFILGDDAE